MDLFGHRKVEHMPLTKMVEDTLYGESGSLSVAMEDNRNNDILGNLRNTIPKFDSWTLEDLSSNYSSSLNFKKDKLLKLEDLSADSFTTAAKNLNETMASIDVNSFYFLGQCVESVDDLVNGVLNNVLAAYNDVCLPGVEVDSSVNFEKAERALTGIVDIVKTSRVDTRDNQISIGPGDGVGVPSVMSHEDFEKCVIVYKEKLSKIERLDTMAVDIMGLVQLCISQAYRVSRDYDKYTDVGRPTLGQLNRMARGVEEIPMLLQRTFWSLRETSLFLNTIAGKLEN